jgi:hypothetical protein
VAVAFTAPDTAWSFTVDVSFKDFEELPDASPAEVVLLAHNYLYGFPMLPLDSDQQASWDSSAD